jgi:methylmalonyl-CoA mutase C-terminal domain/subunit
MTSKKIRVLIAKPGLDGHDRGAIAVAQGQIAEAAIQEDVDVVGLSCLSGGHLTLFSKTTASFRERSDKRVIFIGGGIIPKKDIPKLKEAGISGTFGPGTPINEIVGFIRAELEKGSDDNED